MKLTTEHIKSFIIAILVLVVIFFAFDYFNKPKPLPPPPFNDIQPEQTREVSGIIIRYGSNPAGDVDKFLIEENNQQIWLHFPPHTAKKVLSIAKLHSQVKITMAAMLGKKEAMNSRLQSITNNKNETINIKDILPPPPTQGNQTTVSGKKPTIKTDDNGRPNAFILSGRLIALPPHAAEALMPLISDAKIIVVKGYERSNTDGFVNINSLSLIKPYSIMIDSIQYLVR